MIQFPFMIYHPTYPPEVVNNQVELDEMVNKGWRMSPVPPSVKEMIKSKIKWHEDELETLYRNLDAIDKDEKRAEVKKEKAMVEEAKVIIKEAENKEEKKEKEKEKEVINLICPKCNVACKTEAGLLFHMKKCKGDKKEALMKS